MLSFKEKISQEEYKKIFNDSYLTESAFYIGTIKWIDDLIKKDLIYKLNGDIDGMVVFNLFIKFLVNKFKNTDCTDIYEYIDEYVEEDLQDFIENNFVDIEEKEKTMYVIVMLCKDFDRTYIDYVNEKFNNLEQARKQMFNCVNAEIDTLKSCKTKHSVVNLENSVCIYDDEQELITKYEIIEINS